MKAHILLVASMTALAGCKKPANATPAQQVTADPVVKVTTARVVEKPMPHMLSLTGTLAPNESSDVAANAAGVVLALNVERGSYVDRGAVLARLDARTASLSAQEATAQSASASSQLEYARSECARLDKLFQSGAIAQVEFERQKQQCQTAQFQAEAATVRAQLAQKGIADANVRAPFAGMIADKLVGIGEYVQPSTKVVRLVAIDPLRLELNVPESSVSLLKQGQPVAFQVSAFPDVTFRGEIRYIGPALRAASRDLVVEAVLPNPDKKLRPGMFASADVHLGARPALVVPVKAIRKDGNLQRAFFAVNGRAEERLLETAEQQGDEVVVVQGAHAGDAVIAPVTPDVVDGVKVQ